MASRLIPITSISIKVCLEIETGGKDMSKLREPITSLELRAFTNEEVENTTENERWRIAEIEAYQKRIEFFAAELDRFEAAKLDLRVLVGSKIYEGFLPFGKLLTESIWRVNVYLDILNDSRTPVAPESPEVLKAQLALYPSESLDDELTQEIAGARERGEEVLLAYLHRPSIRG